MKYPGAGLGARSAQRLPHSAQFLFTYPKDYSRPFLCLPPHPLHGPGVVRLEPGELRFRRAAFEAAQTVKKHQRPLQKALDTIDGLLHPNHREIKR